MVFSVVGKRLPRPDARQKAAGETQYAADVHLPGMLHGAVLGSVCPHGRIVRLDTRRAERLPGVRAVVTGRDFPEVLIGGLVGGPEDRPVMARDRVRFWGEPVAAVAAVDETTAQEAIHLIQVEYEGLPIVVDPVEAMKPNAPLVHENLLSYTFRRLSGGKSRVLAKDRLRMYGNVCNHLTLVRGDVERALREADYVFADTYHSQIAYHGYIEPHAAVGLFDAGGRAIVWTTTQAAHRFRADLAATLQLPLTQVKVIPMEVGGGFGGKTCITVEPFCLLLSRKTGRPVRIVMTREEDMANSRPRPQCLAELKTGVMRDGALVSREARFIFDTGAYYGASVPSGIDFGTGPYHIPNFHLESIAVYTNKMNVGPYRGPGTSEVHFATESHIDRIARELGFDPYQFRLKNALRDGHPNPAGRLYSKIGCVATLERVAQLADWPHKPQGPHRGRGMACGQWRSGVGPATACVTANEDGTFSVLVGSVDISGSDTSLAQVVAEELGVGLDRVLMARRDTDLTPFARPSTGSSIIYSHGVAVRRAAADARSQLISLAADMLEANPDDLDLRNGRIFVAGSEEHGLTVAELAREALDLPSGPIMGKSVASGQGGAPTFAAQVADVEVDPTTGVVTLLRIFEAQDVGFALNPLSVEGQMEGGIAQGIGYALTENLVVDQGVPQNPNFLDYKMPTALDMPPLELALVEVNSAEGVYGARGVGEPPIVPTAPAIANAVYDAVGVRINNLPLTPQKVLEALKGKQK